MLAAAFGGVSGGTSGAGSAGAVPVGGVVPMSRSTPDSSAEEEEEHDQRLLFTGGAEDREKNENHVSSGRGASFPAPPHMHAKTALQKLQTIDPDLDPLNEQDGDAAVENKISPTFSAFDSELYPSPRSDLTDELEINQRLNARQRPVNRGERLWQGSSDEEASVGSGGRVDSDSLGRADSSPSEQTGPLPLVNPEFMQENVETTLEEPAINMPNRPPPKGLPGAGGAAQQPQPLQRSRPATGWFMPAAETIYESEDSSSSLRPTPEQQHRDCSLSGAGAPLPVGGGAGAASSVGARAGGHAGP